MDVHDITDKLVALLPELRNFERCTYLYTAQYKHGANANDPDVLSFWERALQVYCNETNSPFFEVQKVLSAFTIHFMECTDSDPTAKEMQLQPLTLQAVLPDLQSQGSFSIYSPHSMQQGLSIESAEQDNTSSSIWNAIVQVLSPTKKIDSERSGSFFSSFPSPPTSTSSSSSVKFGSSKQAPASASESLYVCRSKIDCCANVVRVFAHSTGYVRFRAKSLAASGNLSAGHSDLPKGVLYKRSDQDLAFVGFSGDADPDAAAGSFGATFADLLTYCIAQQNQNVVGANPGALSDDVRLLERLLSYQPSDMAPRSLACGDSLGAQLLLTHMLESGVVQEYATNTNIIKVLPLGFGAAPRAESSASASSREVSTGAGLGLLAALWSSPVRSPIPTPGSAGATGASVVSAEEAAALDLQCHIAAFERRMRRIEDAMQQREQSARQLLSQSTSSTADRFRTRALQQLRAKRVLQQRFDVVAAAAARLDEVLLRCESNAVYADVVEALRIGNNTLSKENSKAETLAEEADDLIAEFNDLRVDGEAVSAVLAGPGIDDADSDIQEELQRLLRQQDEKNSTAAAATAVESLPLPSIGAPIIFGPAAQDEQTPDTPTAVMGTRTAVLS